MTKPTSIAAALRSWREQKGLSEWETAKRCSLRIEQIRRLEDGGGTVAALEAYERFIMHYDHRRNWLTD